MIPKQDTEYLHTSPMARTYKCQLMPRLMFRVPEKYQSLQADYFVTQIATEKMQD